MMAKLKQSMMSMKSTVNIIYALMWFIVSLFCIAFCVNAYAESSAYTNTNTQSSSLCEEYDMVCATSETERSVEGVKVTRPCFKYTYKLKCKNHPTQNDCHLIDPNICDYVGQECVKKLDPNLTPDVKDGICECEKIRYACERQIEYEEEKTILENTNAPLSAKELLCASMCLDGNCDAITKANVEQNTELSSSIGFLHALKEAKSNNGLGTDLISLFKGKQKSCSYHPASFMNCCRNRPTGWGEAISLGHCSVDELQIAKLKAKKQCIEIGTYCKNKIAGFCIDRRKTYCCYDSVIARILIQEAKRQLGLDFGTPEHPNCAGIALTDLEKVDLSNVDFTDFYEQVVVPNIKIPDVAENAKETQESAEKIKKSADPSNAYNSRKDKQGFNPETYSKMQE